MFVADVVRQLQLVEGDDLLHPLLARGGGVRMDVHPLRHLRVRLAGDHPPAPGTEGTHIVLVLGEAYQLFYDSVHYGQ